MLSQLFLEEPYEFAKKHALLPLLGLQATDTLKPKKVDPNLTVYQVKGGNRILFANLVRNPEEFNAIEIEFNPAQASDDWFPVYWLPWQYNSTYRITLKRSQKVLVFDRNERLVSPDVFFTAALTGCLVHVDGDPWEPTVYHSNAIGLPVPPAPKDADKMLWAVKQKALRMGADVQAAQQKYPKSPSHYEPRSATSFEYMPFSVSDQRSKQFAEAAQEKMENKADMVVPSHLGMVFGIRGKSTGTWTFYYQSLIKFIIQKGPTKSIIWVVKECKRFWPGADIQKPIPVNVID